MEVVKKITLDVSRRSLLEYIFAKQGDIKSRYLEITLLDNGLKYDVPDAAIARLQLTKSDKHTVYNDCTIKNGKINVELTEQVLAIKGIAVAEIAVYKNDTYITSQVFYLQIDESALVGTNATSSDEFKALIDAMLRIEEAGVIAQKAKTASEIALENLAVFEAALITSKNNADAAAKKANDAADRANTEINKIINEGVEELKQQQTASENAIKSTGTTEISKVNSAGTTQISNINKAGTDGIEAIKTQQTASENAIKSTGTTEISKVNSVGTTQISKVHEAGAAVNKAIDEKLDTFATKEEFNSLQIGGRNIFILKNASKGYVHNDGTIYGATGTRTLDITSEYIKIENDKFTYHYKTINTTDIDKSWTGVGFYDKDKVFISRWSKYTDFIGIGTKINEKYALGKGSQFDINIPENAVYMRIGSSFLDQPEAHVKLERGIIATDWTSAPEDLTPENIGALPITGGTVTGNLILQKGYAIHTNLAAGPGYVGYIKICTIKINKKYINWPIIIEFVQRDAKDTVKVVIQFANDDDNDPDLDVFVFETNAVAPSKIYAKRESTGVWGFYVRKDDAFERLTITSVKIPEQLYDGIDLTWMENFFATNLPDGSITATQRFPNIPLKTVRAGSTNLSIGSWFKIASINTTNVAQSFNIVMHVYNSYITAMPNAHGILKASFRTGATPNTQGTSLIWEYVSDFDTSSFLLAYNNSNPAVCELWVRVNTVHHYYTFNVISMSDVSNENMTLWTLYDKPTPQLSPPEGCALKLSEYTPIVTPRTKWTPTYSGKGAEWGDNVGIYQKIGNECHLHMHLIVNYPQSSGNQLVVDLPIKSANIDPQFVQSIPILITGIDMTGYNQQAQFVLEIPNASTKGFVSKILMNGYVGGLSSGELTDTTKIYINGSYTVD